MSSMMKISRSVDYGKEITHLRLCPSQASTLVVKKRSKPRQQPCQSPPLHRFFLVDMDRAEGNTKTKRVIRGVSPIIVAVGRARVISTKVPTTTTDHPILTIRRA